ncbi:hypothetical protein OJAV_G00140260 [Oryzias javanicus]|uniref:Uncharacterized protein n=1 Tax=Oryzias javanicus TaxID=123683 RepID=A0A3S2U6A9_ORYJA|nr:hypothetical protein OJAV_G00140260 [Oryzias javanicus]
MCDFLQSHTVRQEPAADSPPAETNKRREVLHSPLTQVEWALLHHDHIPVCLWSAGSAVAPRTKEVLINTNVSGSKAEAQFNDKSQVVELEPHGYRMTLSDYKDKLPHNTTYMCKISGDVRQITVERDSLVPCSAVSVFLQRSWFLIGCLVFFFHHNDS